MDHISNELSKLRIDQSQREKTKTQHQNKAPWVITLLAMLTAGGVVAFPYFKDAKAVTVTTVRPRLESSNDSAVLVATDYVIAHHKVQVGSKVAGRVAWIGVEKGDRVKRDQV